MGGRLLAIAVAAASLGVAAALVNGTSLLAGLTGGLLVGQLAALLAPRDDDDGGVAEEAPFDLEQPVPAPLLTPH